MIAYLARIITEFFIRYDIVNKEDQEIYQYGNEIVISTVFDFLILFSFAFVFHDFITVFLFWIVFFILRKFGGGYHADTYLKCKIIFSINIFLVLFLVHYLSDIYNLYLLMLMTVFSCLVIFLLAPIDNENKPLTHREIRSNSIKCKSCSLLIGIITIVLFRKYMEISFTILLAHFSVVFAMIFEFLRKRFTRQK